MQQSRETAARRVATLQFRIKVEEESLSSLTAKIHEKHQSLIKLQTEFNEKLAAQEKADDGTMSTALTEDLEIDSLLQAKIEERQKEVDESARLRKHLQDMGDQGQKWQAEAQRLAVDEVGNFRCHDRQRKVGRRHRHLRGGLGVLLPAPRRAPHAH